MFSPEIAIGSLIALGGVVVSAVAGIVANVLTHRSTARQIAANAATAREQIAANAASVAATAETAVATAAKLKEEADRIGWENINAIMERTHAEGARQAAEILTLRGELATLHAAELARQTERHKRDTAVAAEMLKLDRDLRVAQREVATLQEQHVECKAENAPLREQMAALTLHVCGPPAAAGGET